MIKAGMDCVRLNFSHGSYHEMKAVFDLVRKLSAKYDHQVTIICDIQGPKIRTGVMKEDFALAAGDKIKVTPDDVIGTKDLIQIQYPSILQDLKQGDTIFVNDGIIKLVVTGKSGNALECVTEAGGHVSNHKGCNIPSGNLSMDVITDKDRKDLEFIAQLDPEYVASSFIGTAADVHHVRDTLKKFGNSKIKIISKIERPVALDNLDAIIEASDAVMVARGDLGVEIPTWQVPIEQKKMCRKCNAAGKPVIVATQMLESMITSSRPTRAEASDVFNAVLDGADAVMLSGETSVGKYPIQCVKIMDDIIAAAETHMPPRNPNDFDSKERGMSEVTAHGCYTLVNQMNDLKHSCKIVVITEPNAFTARMVSKYRPNMDIIALTDDLRTVCELDIVWGVRSVHMPDIAHYNSNEERAVAAVHRLVDMKLLKEADHVIIVARAMVANHAGNFLGLYKVSKLLESQPKKNQ